jgi:hypothetical protein
LIKYIRKKEIYIYKIFVLLNRRFRLIDCYVIEEEERLNMIASSLRYLI